MSTLKRAAAENLETQRQAWIAQAAYYLAERRGFQGGCALEDWLRAEQVFDRHGARSLPPPRMALVFLDRHPGETRMRGS
jgi:hypothetical protein